MPWATGQCPSCGLRFGERKEPPGMYRCRKCKTAVRVEKGGYGEGSRVSVVPNERGELKLMTIPRV